MAGRRPLTAEARVRSQVIAREICGGRSGFLYCKFQMHGSNTSLIIVIKPTVAQRLRTDTILSFYTHD